MASPFPDHPAIAGDAQWLAHRYDAAADAVQFRHVTRDQHRAATFLTDEYLGPAERVIAIPRTAAVASAPAPARLGFVFHSAFCCSTLLARAFDIEGTAMGLKEPVILNDLTGWKRRGAQPAMLAQVLDNSLTLLARPFGPGEAVIVKPSNLVNPFIPAMLTMRPEARALLLYAPLPVFLGSITRKGLWGRVWVRDLMVKFIADNLIDLGFAPEDYLKLTDIQAAAVGWLAQHALFARVAERFGPARVATLDSETLLDQPHAAVAGLARLFGLDVDAAAVATGPAFTSHSKGGRSFTRAERDAERREIEAPHRDEIEKVAIWAKAVADNAGVKMVLPHALTDPVRKA